MISFSYPVRIVTRIFYFRWTERSFSIKIEDLVDFAFFSATFSWAGDVFGYHFFQKAHGHGLIEGLV
jgi:hypothetical protein